MIFKTTKIIDTNFKFKINSEGLVRFDSTNLSAHFFSLLLYHILFLGNRFFPIILNGGKAHAIGGALILTILIS